MDATTISKGIDLAVMYDRLFPICRSITGPGIRKSLEIASEVVPLQIESVPTGTKVLDWTVPKEWELHRARLWDPEGNLILDTDNTNLHVLNFSEAFEGVVTLDQLQQHLYSIEELPDAVPYVTSYYAPRWGLCMSHRQREELKPGDYRVDIQTTKRDGVLNYGVCDLPGETDDIVLISSYLCHPSMANNELSGPLGLMRVWENLSKRKNRRFTYRFLLIPETIGSISYLAHHGEELQRRLHAGVVLTCLGGPSPKVSFKLSRQDWIGQPSPLDLLIRHAAAAEPDRFGVRPFTPVGGSDERQFCSPGFDLPVTQAARTIYAEYGAYHTSEDHLEFMTISAVERSAVAVTAMLEALEVFDRKYRNTIPYGEPQLGRRGLYPTVNGPMTNHYSTDHQKDNRKTLNHLLCILSLADGERSVMEIAEHIGASVLELTSIVRHLVEEGILVEAGK